MTIFLKKFGTTLISRQAGKEAWAAFQPALRDVKDGERLDVDFEGIITFSPSWGDEFLTPLQEKSSNRLTLLHTDNPSVKATLELLEKIHGRHFAKNKPTNAVN